MVSLEYLRQRIQQKRELARLASAVIDERIAACVARHRIALEKISARDAQLIIKEVRGDLRMLASRFQNNTGIEERSALLAARCYRQLLLTHASSAARIADYPFLKKELAARKVTSIADLGSGLNPLALAVPGRVYYAVDIQEDELALVSRFFQQEGIAGTTLVCDLRTSLPALPSVDACLLMNVLDVIEKRKGHKRAEEILTSITAKYFFITFSTKTLSGKPMRHPQRGWIERLLTRRGYVWKRTPLSSEILYIAESHCSTACRSSGSGSGSSNFRSPEDKLDAG
jgi:hypothetical protein